MGKKHVIFFFYPKDFTFVCPTELHAFHDKLDEFEKRILAEVACSTATKQSHWGWLQTPKAQGGIQRVKHPIVADTRKTMAMNYDVLFGEYELDENNSLLAAGPMIAYLGLYLIDKNGIIRHHLINDLSLGRNVDEALRMVDALQFCKANGEVCPANWHKGDDAMKTTLTDVANYLAKP